MLYHMLNYSDFAGRRGLSNLSAHRRPPPEDQDVDQDGQECGVWPGVHGKQEVHSSVSSRQ